MATTQQQYDSSILSAEVSYDGDLQQGSIITRGDQTLKVVQIYSDSETTNTGFKGVVYQDLSTNAYIASFTGTQSTDIKDAYADYQMSHGEVPDQFNSAKDFMQNLKASDGSSITTDQIQSITGHSLGGSLAEMIGALKDYKDVNVDTYNAYGVDHLLDDLAKKEKLSNDYSNINNYGDGEDLVYRSSDHIGNDHSVNPDTSDWDILDDAKKQGDGNGWKDDHMFDNLRNKKLSDFIDKKIDDLGLHDLNNNSDYSKKGLKDHLKDLLRDLMGDDLFEDLFHQAEAATNPIPGIWRDPLLVDLDGDGIETTTVQNGTYFDHGNDGFAESSAWVGSDDGVLAFDKNNDGVINDGGEIFGDNYVLSNGQKATTGFQALADLDSNLDGVIDSSDTNFSNIKVLKGDGNLLTLAEAGIASINLTNTTTSTTDANGNIQLRAGTYTKTDATTGVIGDYSLSQDAMYSISTDWVEVSAEIAALPDASGYGTVDTLHQAMAKDTTGALKALVESFIVEPDISQKRTILTEIIYKWCGADTVSSASRGTTVNGQQLYALEKFIGENFVGAGNTTNPNSEAANFLNAAYSNLSEYIFAQLASQTFLKPVFDEITMQYDTETNSIVMDLSQATEYIRTTIVANEIAGRELLSEFDQSFKALGLKDGSNYSSFESTFTSLGTDYKFLLDTTDKKMIYGTSGDDYFDGTALGEAYMAGDGNDTIYARQGDDMVYAGNGNDFIDSCEGNDIINGGDDNDKIWGNDGSDNIVGGSGDDEIHGGANNDTICGGSETLTGDGKNNLYGDGGNDFITGGDNNDYIDGGDDNDVLDGGAGNDLLIGGAGDDYLTGGYGTDMLMGGAGNDTYFMNYQTSSSVTNFDGKSMKFMPITKDTIIDSDGIVSVIKGNFSKLSSLKGA